MRVSRRAFGAVVAATVFGATGFIALASEVDVSVVDVTVPTASVTLQPGGPSGIITINMTVTGAQAGTATFEVNRNWTLSGGTFIGSNPEEFTVVGPRTGSAPPTIFSTTGTVSVAAAQAPGTFTLSVGAFDITNTNTTGGKLSAGDSSTYSVTVAAPSDTTPPVVTVPANVTAEATEASGAAVTFAVTASDINPPSPTVTCTPSSGSTFPLGTTTVSCSAIDAAGNTGSASFTVTVQDTTAPDVDVPANVVDVEATGPSGAPVDYGTVTASDLVDGEFDATCSPASGSTFPLGTTTVSCSAIDAAGNTGSASFTVTVQDTTAPDVDVPANVVDVEATGPSGAPVDYGTVTASDLVDGEFDATCSPASGSTFPLGTTTVSCSAADKAGNTGSASFTVTVQDTTPPVVTPPAAPAPAEATGPAGAAVSYGAASAVDIVDGPLTATCSPSSGSTFAVGNSTVNCSATDAHGNTGSASFTVTVQDTTPPVVTPPAAPAPAEATGPAGAAVSYGAASAVDIVDGPLTATCSPPSGSTFAVGNTTVNCSATDAHGNTGSASFTITVQDTTPPTVANHINISAEATGPSGAMVTYSNPTANDIVDGPLATTCVPASGSTFGIGTTTVNCSATDAHGNTGSASFTITVQYQLKGFYQPVDMNGVYNTIKGGSTVPLKFEVFAGSTELTSTTVVDAFRQTKIDCDGTHPTDDIEVTSTGGTSLRYDTTGGQFIQNWKTPTGAGSCYKVTMTTQGGSSLTAFFKLK